MAESERLEVRLTNYKVVICIVADGRKAVNPRVLDCLAALGVYQEGAHF